MRCCFPPLTDELSPVAQLRRPPLTDDAVPSETLRRAPLTVALRPVAMLEKLPMTFPPWSLTLLKPVIIAAELAQLCCRPTTRLWDAPFEPAVDMTAPANGGSARLPKPPGLSGSL